MIKELHFMQQEFLWPALALAFLLVVLYIWTVWKGNFNGRFFANSLVGVLAVGALLLLFLRPAWSTEVSGSAVLLTQGYDLAQLDSIKKQKKGIGVINYKTGMDLSSVLDSVGQVTVLGQGLRDFDLWQLKGMPVNYLGGSLSKGVVKLKYSKEHRVGRELSIRGLYHQPILGNRMVLQSASGEGLDSIVFDSETEQVFDLNINPRATGKFVYRLTEKDSVGTILNIDPLPVEVLERQALRIFISNNFPSFETKYLKNFLAEEGHEVVVRSQITKDKYKFEYFNTERNAVYGFPENDLTGFDVLILDADTFLNLSKSARETLMKLIKEQGTGIFVQPSESLFRTANAMVDFGLERDGTDEIPLLAWPKLVLEKYPFTITNDNAKGIAIENHSYALVVGKGRLSTTLLIATYQLVLDGKGDPYREIWSKIIEATARSQEKATSLKARASFAFKDIPYPVVVQTEVEKPMVQLSDDFSVPLLKDAVLKDTWHGKTYPIKTGWQTLKMSTDSSMVKNYFVMDTLHWKSLIGANTILENSRFFTAENNMSVNKLQIIELSRWWFFLLFLCCMGYLWLVPKVGV